MPLFDRNPKPKKRARPFASFLLAMILCTSLLSCTHRNRSPVIAIIESTGGTSFWRLFSQNVSERAQHFGLVLNWSDPQSAAEYEVQAKLLSNAVQQHVNGIILAPSHQLVLAEGVRRAYAAGIPVVIVDSPIAVQPSEYVTSIGCSDEAIGFMAAQQFTQTIGSRARILVVGASPTLQTTAQREESLRRALARFDPGARIVASRYSLSDWARARRTTLDALSEKTEINAVFSSDDFSTHGVLNALRSIPPSRHLTSVTVDNGAESVEGVRSGLLSAAIACDAGTIGRLAVEAMHDALEGRPVEKLIQTEAILITKKNIDTPAVHRIVEP
jgi:ribose transport system substrate-binding protein